MKYPINLKLISDYMKANNLTIKAFCEKCEMSVTTYYKVMRGENVTCSILSRIMRGAGIELKDLFIKTSDTSTD